MKQLSEPTLLTPDQKQPGSQSPSSLWVTPTTSHVHLPPAGLTYTGATFASNTRPQSPQNLSCTLEALTSP